MESKGFLLLNERCAAPCCLLCNSFEFRVNIIGGTLESEEDEEEDVGEDWLVDF